LVFEPIAASIRDVILPGEMKTQLNRVTKARQAAKANLIVRPELTAPAAERQASCQICFVCRRLQASTFTGLAP